MNETFRRTALQNGPAVGETIEAGPCGRAGCTVVGVVADAVYGRSLRDPPPPTIYMPLAQSPALRPDMPFRLSVRAAGDVMRLTPDLTRALRGVDPRLTFAFAPLDLDVRAAAGQERLMAELAGFFGAVALLLSAIGLYGVTSCTVTARRTEIGIRLALGAAPAAVVRLMLARVAVFVVVGTVAGLSAAVWLSRFVAPLLYGLEARDPATLAGAVVTLASVAAAAAWIPASRRVRVDPSRALREY